MKKSLLACTGLALATGVVAAPSAGAAHEGQMRRVYTGELHSVNAPGASGTVTIEVFDHNKAVVTIAAAGLTPDGSPHAQHIHMPEAGDASCPTVAGSDTDNDGVVSTVEGAPAYGGVVTSLTTEGDTSASSALAVERFPVGTDGSYQYMRAPIELDSSVATDLGRGAVIIHGVDFDGSGAYDGEARSSLNPDLPLEATAPAICGALTLREVRLPAPYAGTSGTQADVTRYYAALLDRAPDESGYAYWVDDAQTNGVHDTIVGLAGSAEFTSRFGDVVNGDVDAFVDFVYISTLGRVPDEGGRQHWTTQLDDGFDRVNMIALFADSPEFKALTGTT